MIPKPIRKGDLPDQFVIGGVVKLKSGGCNMVIEGYHHDELGQMFYTCVWHTTDYGCCSRDFLEACLEDGV